MNARGRLLGCATLVVYAYLYAPIVVLVVYSFNSAGPVAQWEGMTLDHYGTLAHDSRLLDAAINSLIVAGAATVAATCIGTAAALGLWLYPSRAAQPTRGLLYLPVIVPEVVMGVALLVSFAFVQLHFGLMTIIMAHVAFCVSYVAIVVRARLAGLDRSLLEASADLGAAPLATFARVTLPLILPGILAGALLAFTVSLDDYVVTSLVSGPGSGTLPMQIWSMVHTGVKGEVNALCTVLLAATLLPILLAQRLLRGPGDRATGVTDAAAPATSEG